MKPTYLVQKRLNSDDSVDHQISFHDPQKASDFAERMNSMEFIRIHYHYVVVPIK